MDLTRQDYKLTLKDYELLIEMRDDGLNRLVYEGFKKINKEESERYNIKRASKEIRQAIIVSEYQIIRHQEVVAKINGLTSRTVRNYYKDLTKTGLISPIINMRNRYDKVINNLGI